MGIADLILYAAGKPVRGAGADFDAGKLQPADVPTFVYPDAWEDADELERNYQDALFLAEALHKYALNFPSQDYTREAWLEAALEIYAGARVFNGYLAEIKTISDYRTFSGGVLSQRALDNLQGAGEEVDKAVRIADAYLAGAEDLANERIMAARRQAERHTWQSVVQELKGMAAQAVAEGAETIGEAARRGWEKTFPWGPILAVGALVTGGVVAAVVLSK